MDFFAEVKTAFDALQPPVEIVGTTQSESFDNADVTLRDGEVLWRVVRERPVIDLVAAPAFDTRLVRRRSALEGPVWTRLFGECVSVAGGGNRGPRPTVGRVATRGCGVVRQC
jgi:hypothetical protein